MPFFKYLTIDIGCDPHFTRQPQWRGAILYLRVSEMNLCCESS